MNDQLPVYPVEELTVSDAKTTTAWLQGITAYRLGRELESNPFPKSDTQRYIWQDGWYQGLVEAA